jgi:hypothetical protein
MANDKKTVELPGSICKNGSRWWWKVKQRQPFEKSHLPKLSRFN